MATEAKLVQKNSNEMCGNTCVKLRPKVDLLESADTWLLHAAMPGVDERGAEVSLERDVLTIRGQGSVSEPEGFERQYGEFRVREYERSFRLPEEIDRENLDASVRHGVLTVTIPKAKAAQPTKVTVRGA